MSAAVSLAVLVPSVFRVNALSRVAVPAAVAGEPGIVSGDFVFPRAVEVMGVLVVPADGLRTTLAQLSLGILDDRDQRFASDHRGRETGPFQPFVIGCLAMMGKDFRPFPLLRTPQARKRWTMTLKNVSAGIINIAATLLYYKETPGGDLPYVERGD